MSNPTKGARLRLLLRTFFALLGMASTVGATPPEPVDSSGARQVLETRVLAIRAAINRAPERNFLGEPFGTLAQWYNWNNWGNWPNWANWGNWFNR